MADTKQAPEETPSSHETCGQFPADEVAATHAAAAHEAESKSRSKS